MSQKLLQYFFSIFLLSSSIAVAADLESLIIQPDTVDVDISDGQQSVKAMAVYSDYTISDVTDQANWDVADTSTATNDGGGKFTPIAEGTTYIFANYQESGRYVSSDAMINVSDDTAPITELAVLQHRQIQQSGCKQNIVASETLPVATTVIYDSLDRMGASCDRRPVNYIDFDVTYGGTYDSGAVILLPSYMDFGTEKMALDSAYCTAYGSGQNVIFLMPSGTTYSTTVTCQ